MLNLIQISDLHAGTEDLEVLKAGIVSINKLDPDFILIAGDLTQRALPVQFRQCLEFLKKLKATKLIVPGNHDIPLYNIFQRLVNPYSRFIKHFQPEVGFQLSNQDCTIVGLSTLFRWHYKSGQIKRKDIEKTIEIFKKSPEKIKIIVSHHPVGELIRIGDRKRFKELLAMTDLWLAGHTHRFKITPLAETYQDISTVQCCSGTFISKRTRQEENSFNQILIEKNGDTVINHYVFDREKLQFILGESTALNLRK